jgi:transcriptional regulator with XRE-family HTH domain
VSPVAEPRSPRTVAFGRAVRQLRTERRLTQEAFAELADLDRTYVSGIERGVRNPTLEMIHKLARGFDLRASELVRLAEGLEAQGLLTRG